MSELHQQAINYVYLQVLQKLQCHYSHLQRLALEELLKRIALAAGGYSRVGSFRLMIAHGGSRDSTQAVAFLRAAQLSMALRCGQTFSLRIVTCRHVPLGEPLKGNLQRLYAALFVTDDPRVELLVADDRHVRPLEFPDVALEPLGTGQRLDLLMAGQLTGADVRATFCHTDHQRLARALQYALRWQSGVDAVAQIDPPQQRNQYMSWFRRLARGARLLQEEGAEVPPKLLCSITELQSRLGEVPAPPPNCRILMLDDLMKAVLEAPCEPLLAILGFRLPDLRAAVSEADCADPLAIAHINGLRAESLTLLDYRDGIEHYLALAAPLLRDRRLPEPLLRDALANYASKRAMLAHRKRANAWIEARYGLRENHLKCMLFAPFVDHGAGLPRYLKQCDQSLPFSLPYLHSALRGDRVPEQVVHWLTDVSGLPLPLLQKLYDMTRVHIDDDHTLLARTRHWPTSARGIQGLHPVTGLPACDQRTPTDD